MTDLIGPFWDLYVTGLNGRVGQGQRLVKKPAPISFRAKKIDYYFFFFFFLPRYNRIAVAKV